MIPEEREIFHLRQVNKILLKGFSFPHSYENIAEYGYNFRKDLIILLSLALRGIHESMEG